MRKKPSKTYLQTTQTCREISATISEMKKTLAEMKACTRSKGKVTHEDANGSD